MTHSALQLAALAAAAVPGLEPTKVDPCPPDGSEFDLAIVTDDRNQRWMVRAARKLVGAASLDVERQILPELARRLTVAVPTPIDRAAGNCLVYPYLPGRPLDPQHLQAGSDLARDLGQLIASLHELDPQVFEDAGLPRYSADEYRLRRLSDVDRAARSGQVPPSLLERWEKHLTGTERWQFTPTPTHGDLTGAQILLADDRVSALIGWGQACVADPADDLAWVILGADPAAVDTVIEAYAMARSQAPDPYLLDRATLAGELSLARWLLTGIAAQEQSVIDQAAAALRDLAQRGD